jgi:hypothetical protein
VSLEGGIPDWPVEFLGKSGCRFWGKRCPVMDQNSERMTSGHDIDPTKAMRFAICSNITGKRSAKKISEGKSHSTMEARENPN